MIEIIKDEAHELVLLYDSLLEAKANSRNPTMYDDAIKQTRRSTIGAYQQLTNKIRRKYEEV